MKVFWVLMVMLLPATIAASEIYEEDYEEEDILSETVRSENQLLDENTFYLEKFRPNLRVTGIVKCVEKDVYYSGTKIRIIRKMKRWQQCQANCKWNPQCVAWTFKRKGWRTLCSLMDAKGMTDGKWKRLTGRNGKWSGVMKKECGAGCPDSHPYVSDTGSTCCKGRDCTDGCPKKNPYAYLTGSSCCDTNKEDNYAPDGEFCDGSAIAFDSKCCGGLSIVDCPHGHGKCMRNYNGGEPSPIECPQGNGNCKNAEALQVHEKWNKLTVYNKEAPLSEEEAKKAGWRLLRDSCKDGLEAFVGRRYVLGDDMANIIIFNANGNVAGKQMGMKLDADFIGLKGKYASVYIPEDGYHYVTVYFRDRQNVCEETWAGDGSLIGDRLTIVTGMWSYMQVPLREENILQGTKWVLGKCIERMGQHYLYDVNADMSCTDVFPLNVMYTEGKLNAFAFGVFAFDFDVNSNTIEKAPSSVVKRLFEEGTFPKCILDLAHTDSQHNYFQSVSDQNYHCKEQSAASEASE